MILANSKWQSWTSPETAENLEQISVQQIIAPKLKLQYLGSIRILCNSVPKAISNKMNNIVYSIEKKQNSGKVLF